MFPYPSFDLTLHYELTKDELTRLWSLANQHTDRQPAHGKASGISNSALTNTGATSWPLFRERRKSNEQRKCAGM